MVAGIMSYDRSSLASASTVQGCSSRESQVSQVTFNIDGQPIGDNADSLSTMIGHAVKNNVSPAFYEWSGMPDKVKEKVWDVVTNKYEISIENKEWVDSKVNELWRYRKSNMKRSIFTKYHTDVDRKKNVPSFVGKEDWRGLSTYARRLRHNVNELQNSDKEVTRMQVWQETHTKEDGSFSSPQMQFVLQEDVRRLHENDPSIAQGNLDQDLIAWRELKSNATLHTKVKQLKERMRKMEHIFSSYGWGQTQFLSDNGSSSQVRQVSPRQGTRSDQATTQTGSTLCKLLHLAKNACVAYGRPIDELAEESSWQRILLDKIIGGN